MSSNNYQISKATIDRAAFLRAEASRLAKVRDEFDPPEACQCEGTGLVMAESGHVIQCPCVTKPTVTQTNSERAVCSWCEPEAAKKSNRHTVCADCEAKAMAEHKRQRAIYLNKRAYVESGFEGTFEEWERTR